MNGEDKEEFDGSLPLFLVGTVYQGSQPPGESTGSIPPTSPLRRESVPGLVSPAVRDGTSHAG